MKTKRSSYPEFYQYIIDVIPQGSKRQDYLIMINRGITHMMYGLYPLMLLGLFLKNSRALTTFILIPAVSFVLVSLVRKWLNRPRPYEDWNIVPLIAKDSQGRSMPSRHVFSAAMISMCALRLNVWLGVSCLVLSVILAICRVLGGVHYPKDVLVGMTIGVLSGLLFWVIL